MTNYDELLKMWGRDRFRAAGYKIDDNSAITVEFETKWSGGCDTCGWDENYLVLTVGSYRLDFDSYSVVSLLQEILKYGAESVK